MATFNGHHCWNCWNVALWIGNDEPLYRHAIHCRRITTRASDAARYFIGWIGEDTRTPDGARYTHKAVKAALEGLE
jgi:hypothetical protein